MEHYTLKNLALQRFGKHVSELFVKMLVLSKRFSEHEFDRKYLKQTCLYLEEYVHKNLPRTLANDLSDVMIRMISLALKLQWKSEFENTWNSKWDQNRHNYYYGAESFDGYSDFVDKSTALAVQISCAVTHKSLTTFKCDEASDLCFQQKYLQQMLLRTVNFKEIILDKMPMITPLPHLPILECLSSQNTKIDIVKNVTEGNDRLKILNMQMAGIPHFQGREVCDFILKLKNMTHLNITGVYFLDDFIRERFFQSLGSVKEFSGSSDCSSHRTELKCLALFPLHDDHLFIPRFLPNITSLEITLFHEIDLFPLKDLKNLTSLAIMAPTTPFSFPSFGNLIQEIGSRLLVLKVFLSAVNFKLIATHCTQLKSFVYCFTSTMEQFVGPAVASGTISNYFASKITTVENLELRLHGEHIWICFPYILNCFPNIKKLKLHSLQKPEEQNVSLRESIILPLSSGHFEEFIFNNKKVEICGERAFITSSNGYVVTIPVRGLEDVMKDIRLCKEIPDMGRKYIVVPRQKFNFPITMMQQFHSEIDFDTL